MRQLNLNRRDFLRMMGIGAAGAMAGCTLPMADDEGQNGPTGRRPNIVLIWADDLGYGDVGCYGNKLIPTPHIDALATAGIRFTDAYVSAPVCSPSRAGLLTGRYQQRFGHENNPGYSERALEEFGLTTDEPIIAERLVAAGYATGMVGKWHLGRGERFRPYNRGFQEYFGFLEGWHRNIDVNGDGRGIWRNDQKVPVNEYLPDAFNREARQFIERHKDEPFFLYLSHNAPHTPIEATDKYLNRVKHIEDEKLRTYAAMISALDDGVGLVVDTLKQLGIEKDTLVLFISDNGGSKSAAPADNSPLSGRKAGLLEGGIRVPWIAYWPGHVPAGMVCHQPVSSLDVLPTALAMADAKSPVEKPLDGKNLLPLLTADKPDAITIHDKPLFWRFGEQAAARKGDWKIHRARQADPWKLFNLADDMGETKDLAAQKPEIVAELATAYEAWDAQLIPPTWTYETQ